MKDGSIDPGSGLEIGVCGFCGIECPGKMYCDICAHMPYDLITKELIDECHKTYNRCMKQQRGAFSSRIALETAMRAGWGPAQALLYMVIKLRKAIITHRAQKADDRCIEDDDRLYEALGDGIKCDRRVGCKEDMLANCKRFIENRCDGGGWPTYAQLEEENKRLREQLDHSTERIMNVNERLRYLTGD